MLNAGLRVTAVHSVDRALLNRALSMRNVDAQCCLNSFTDGAGVV